MDENGETMVIEATRPGATMTLSLRLEELGDAAGTCRIHASAERASWIGDGEDFFHALQVLRGKLEPDGWRLCCYGASRNVYPSPMSRDMSRGLKAYRSVLGTPGRTKDLVEIFAVGEDFEPATVEEQLAFHQAWLASLRR
jgi:hypothetical protein